MQFCNYVEWATMDGFVRDAIFIHPFLKCIMDLTRNRMQTPNIMISESNIVGNFEPSVMPSENIPHFYAIMRGGSQPN
jgi:hypothetical protein